jgi:hypothetical protein
VTVVFFRPTQSIPIVRDGVGSEANIHFDDDMRSAESTCHLRRRLLCNKKHRIVTVVHFADNNHIFVTAVCSANAHILSGFLFCTHSPPFF